MWILSLLVSPADACEWPSPSVEAVWPRYGAVVPPDTVILFRRLELTDEVALLDADGEVVETTAWVLPSVDGSGSYDVLVPEAPLEPGNYSARGRVISPDRPFTVEDGVTEINDPPVPVWKVFATSLEYTNGCMGMGVHTMDAATYRLCGDALLYVVAEGDVAPPEATLGDPGLWASEEDILELSTVLGAGEGYTGTLWFGAFDHAGRFSGWSGPDTVEMPAVHHREGFVMPGAEGSGIRPDRFSYCPEYGEWVSSGLEFCPLVGESWACEPAAPATSPRSSAGRGCATTPAGAGWLVVWGLALLVVVVADRGGRKVDRT